MHHLQRIAEIIKRKNKQRLAKAQALAKKEAAGDFSHYKNKKGEFISTPLPQPTLPNISLDDDETSSVRTRGAAPSTYTGASDYYSDRKDYGVDYPPMDYPPMPAFSQPYGNHQYNPSVGTLPTTEDQHYDDNDYGSTANLTLGAAPISYPDVDPRANMFSPQGHGTQPQTGLYAYNADPHAAYRAASPSNANVAPQYRGPSPAPSVAPQYRGPSPAPQQYYSQDQDLYGHSASGGQRREGDGHDYGAGQAHAL